MTARVRAAAFVPAALAILAMVLASGPVRAIEGRVAVLQGLDKVTARVSEIDVPVGGTAKFGTLRITVRRCYKAPPEDTPESAAFLEIVDIKPGEPPVELFVGWMFASSPALSALEHPVYDVWVLDCRGSEATGLPGAPSSVPPPPAPSPPPSSSPPSSLPPPSSG